MRKPPDVAEVAYRTILIPLDGSDRAQAALPHAIGVARRCGSRLVLFRATELPTVLPLGGGAPAPAMGVPAPLVDTVQLSREAQQAAEESLNTHLRELEAMGLPAEARFGEGGDVAAQILEAAEQVDADLIAMTTHGRTGLDRLLFGSVAESVLRQTAVPILLVRTEESGNRSTP